MTDQDLRTQIHTAVGWALLHGEHVGDAVLKVVEPVIRKQVADEIVYAIGSYATANDDGGREFAGLETAADIVRAHAKETS